MAEEHMKTYVEGSTFTRRGEGLRERRPLSVPSRSAAGESSRHNHLEVHMHRYLMVLAALSIGPGGLTARKCAAVEG
jgi:hypothetical protein